MDILAKDKKLLKYSVRRGGISYVPRGIFDRMRYIPLIKTLLPP
jgi:hypothetical protein